MRLSLSPREARSGLVRRRSIGRAAARASFFLPPGLCAAPPGCDKRGMCVVALALRQHPRWPILVVGNRDEVHARAAEPLHAWADGSGIVAGRDSVGGGTWLGVNPERSRLAVVTNVRGAAPTGPAPGADPGGERPSRGALVRAALTGPDDGDDPPPAALDRFDGFTLIRLARGQAALLTNRPAPRAAALGEGVHAIANAPAGAPCPRAARLAEAVGEWLAAGGAPPEALLDRLADSADPALFLRGAVYGTRCTTLVAIDPQGQGRIIERRFAAGGAPAGETALDFRFGG